MKTLRHNISFTRLGYGFTLIELLVVIAIIAILATILLPSLNKARDLAKTAACTSNQRAIVTGLHIYTNDYAGLLPPWGRSDYNSRRMWNYLLGPYAEGSGQWIGQDYMRCPQAKTDLYVTYGVNYCRVFGIEGNQYFPRSMNLVDVEGRTILTAETSWGMNLFYNPSLYRFNTQLADYGMLDSFGPYKFNFFDPRHSDETINVCSFADGHVEGVYIVDFLNNKGDMWTQ